MSGAERCSWCGEAVEVDDGFRAYEPARERRATFCRLEHLVAWAIRGPHWEAGAPGDPPGTDLGDICAHCGDAVSEVGALLVRHRAEHRIADSFCGVEHLAAWAKSGGRWQSA